MERAWVRGCPGTVTDYATLLLNSFVIVILHVIILEIYASFKQRSRTRNAAVFDALVMQFSICMTKRATQPDHSLLARSMNTVSGHSSMSSFSSLEEQGRK